MILGTLLVLEVLAVLLAGHVVRSRALSLLLGFALVNELAIAVLQELVLHDAPRPFAGPARVAYHVETAFVLGWPTALCAASWATFLTARPVAARGGAYRSAPESVRTEKVPCRPRAPVLVGAAWVAALVVLVVAYPLPRGWTAPVLHALEGAAVLASAVAIAKGWRFAAVSSRAGIAVGLLVVVEGAVSILGAWGSGAGVFTRWNDLARLPYALAWGVLVAMFITWGAPWKRPS